MDSVDNIGEIVHYVAYNKACLAAMIIASSDEGVDLVVWTSLNNVNGIKNFGQQFHQDIKQSFNMTPGTWHPLHNHVVN